MDATLTKAQQRRLREGFLRARKAEEGFARQLRGLARQVGHIVDGFAPGGRVEDLPGLTEALRRYSDLIRPWARKVAGRMVAEAAQRDGRAWMKVGREVGRLLSRELLEAPVGAVQREMLDEQVTLISSLPLGAAKRVHRLTLQAQVDGTRAAETAKEIARTGKVTASRAMLIARTETSRTVSALTEARAKAVGSEQYVWHTAGDSDVRELHKDLNGLVFAWDDPPVAGESGERAHPGGIYNCRCWAEPLLPDVIE